MLRYVGGNKTWPNSLLIDIYEIKANLEQQRI